MKGSTPHPPWAIYESPLGRLTLLGGSSGLTRLRFPSAEHTLARCAHRPDAFPAAVEQLEDYFAGALRGFELELELRGTSFQRRVWTELQQIPYGTTTSYSALARAVGQPDHVRDVAAAIGQTPVPIVIPCHRVVAADGALTGYGGGLERKRALLELEGRCADVRVPHPAWAFRQLTLG